MRLIVDERHDVIARIEVQEMTASGKYEPSECRKASDLVSGSFILHLGVQRRLRLVFSHGSGKQLQFKRIADVKMGSIREVDARGKLISSAPAQRASAMRVLSSKLTALKHEAHPVEAITTFETSISDSDMMDRKTPPGNRIIMSITVLIECERVSEAIPFSMDLVFEVHSRNSGDPGWLAIFTPVKPVNTATYGQFELILTPAARRGRRSLWKRSSAQGYIRGEEILGRWRPRGVSLLADHYAFEKSLSDNVELEIAKCIAKGTFEHSEGSEEEYQKLLQYCVDLWKTPRRDYNPYVQLSKRTF